MRNTTVVTGIGCQSGLALLVGLIFLILMTLIGLFVMRGSVMELQMASNEAGKVISFERAENVRIAAEDVAAQLADNISSGATFDCDVIGFYAQAGVTATEGNCQGLNVMNWDDNDSIESNGSRYAIEYLGRDTIELHEHRGRTPAILTPIHMFNIVTRGTEAAGAESILRSTFIRRDAGS